MGAPSSSILSEIFLQHVEHSHLPRLTKKHRLINYEGWNFNSGNYLFTTDTK